MTHWRYRYRERIDVVQQRKNCNKSCLGVLDDAFGLRIDGRYDKSNINGDRRPGLELRDEAGPSSSFLGGLRCAWALTAPLWSNLPSTGARCRPRRKTLKLCKSQMVRAAPSR